MSTRSAGATTPDRDYEAEIRWTAHGVPHIRAADWGALGFGQGYACAGHHLGTIADQVIKVRGERARHLGAGPDDRHVDSDLAYRFLALHDRASDTLPTLAPDTRALVTGYAAGLTAWLEQGGRDRLPEWCAGAPWLGPVSAVDLFAMLADLALAASGRNLVDYVALARPPGPDGPAPTPPLGLLGTLASNGWAIGKDASASGHGMVVANPHFPWYGEARFWECHLTLPGQLDVYGATLIGVPGVLVGCNRHVAWTHTFSIGKRFTLYRLELDPADPTRYKDGSGAYRAMVPAEVAVGVLGDDGVISGRERTLWRSHLGPMLNLPLFGWTAEVGFTYRDANDDPGRFVSQWQAMATASDLDSFQEAFRREHGIPWVTTEAADASGRAWFVDAAHTANLSPAGDAWYAGRLRDDPLTALLDRNRIALLEAAEPACEWVTEPGSPHPGLLPLEGAPQLERADWVQNANESHWLTNPAQPLVGFPPLLGVEEAEPTPRTRANLSALTAPGSGPDGRLTFDDLTERVFANRSVTAAALRAAVAERLAAAGSVTLAGQELDLAKAAGVLGSWDGTYDLEARGAVLWRELMASLPLETLRRPGALWAEPFSIADPTGTPRGLAPPPAEGGDPLAEAAGRALQALAAAGVAIDAPLGTVQWARRGGRRVPVHGGHEVDGVTNILSPIGLLPSSSLEPVADPPAPVAGRTALTGLAAGGYEVTYGTSYVLVVELTDDGPRAASLLAYGQSGDPASPHHTDQLALYAEKRLRPVLFSDAAIEADPELRRQVVRSGHRAGER